MSARCPICKSPISAQYRPFCSRRCADLDLGRWLTGAYAAPSEELDAPDAETIEQAARHPGERGPSGGYGSAS